MTAPTVPTLKIADGEGLQDSLAIAEYIERNYPKGPSIFGQTASEKNLQLFFDSYVSTRLHPAIQRLVYIEMYEHQDAENAAYFKSSREKGGKTLEQLGGDQAQNLKELKDNLGLIHSALLRSGGWITGEQRTISLCFLLCRLFEWLSVQAGCKICANFLSIHSFFFLLMYSWMG